MAEGKSAGFVVDGSVVSFDANVSAQARQDILDSILLAQMAANHAADRHKDIELWYGKYTQVLQSVGWVTQGFNFTEYESSGVTVTMDKVVLALLAAIASKNEVAVVNEALAALEALDDGDGRLILFETASRKHDYVNFQAGVASELNGAVTLSLGGFHFTSSFIDTRFLWFGFKESSIKLYNGKTTFTLDTNVYDRVRNRISDKLGGGTMRPGISRI